MHIFEYLYVIITILVAGFIIMGAVGIDETPKSLTFWGLITFLLFFIIFLLRISFENFSGIFSWSFIHFSFESIAEIALGGKTAFISNFI